MTKDKDFKRRVRERMAKTGEAYTTARARLLSKRHSVPLPDDYAGLAGKSDETISEKTGRSWPEWVQWLDSLGAAAMPHGEIARRVGEEVESGWWAQTVTVGYERIRGLREVGQRRGGQYEAGRSRTIAVPVEELFRWFADADARGRWLDVDVHVRTATAPKSVRMTWPDGTSVECYFQSKGERKSSVAVQHTKLPDRDALERSRAFWGERLDALKELME